jgi:hypothetical protein
LVLFAEQATQAIKDFGAADIRELEGKPCWVDVDAEGERVTFLRAARQEL